MSEADEVPMKLPEDPLDLDLSDDLREQFGEAVVAVVVSAGNPLFCKAAQIEAQVFPESVKIFDVPDQLDLFQFLLIVKEGAAHLLMRLSGPGLFRGTADLIPFFLTDLADNGGGISVQELRSFYADSGVELERSFSVETLLKLGPNLAPIGSADLGYMTLFTIEERTDAHALFAHLNDSSISSLDRVGIHWSPLADRVDLRTPTIGEDGARVFDPDYRPICIPGKDPRNAPTIAFLEPVAPPLYILE